MGSEDIGKWAATWQNQQNECAPSEDSDQLGHPPSLIRVFAVCMKKPWVLSYPLSAQRRLWSDWEDAQADLSLRWAHGHFVGFVMSRLKCNSDDRLFLSKYAEHDLLITNTASVYQIATRHHICFVCLCWGLTSQSTIFQSCQDGATTSWVINQYFRGVIIDAPLFHTLTSHWLQGVPNTWTFLENLAFF